MNGHRDPDCTGKWRTKRYDGMGITRAECDECNGTTTVELAQYENELAEKLNELEMAGRRLLGPKW